MHTHTYTQAQTPRVFQQWQLRGAQQCLSEPHCLLPPPPPPHLSSLSLFILSAPFISVLSSLRLSLHTHSSEYGNCDGSYYAETPTLSFSCLSLLMKRIVQQVTSQQLWMTVCGKALKTALCGWLSL